MKKNIIIITIVTVAVLTVVLFLSLNENKDDSSFADKILFNGESGSLQRGTSETLELYERRSALKKGITGFFPSTLTDKTPRAVFTFYGMVNGKKEPVHFMHHSFHLINEERIRQYRGLWGPSGNDISNRFIKIPNTKPVKIIMPIMAANKFYEVMEQFNNKQYDQYDYGKYLAKGLKYRVILDNRAIAFDFEIPEDIKDGEVVTFEFDVDKDGYNWRETEYFNTHPKVEPKLTFSGKIDSRFTKYWQRRMPMVVYNWSANVNVNKDRTFKVYDEKLGKNLSIFPKHYNVNNQQRRVPLFCKWELTEKEVSFPEDADLVIEDKDLVFFKLDTSILPFDDTRRIILSLDKDMKKVIYWKGGHTKKGNGDFNMHAIEEKLYLFVKQNANRDTKFTCIGTIDVNRGIENQVIKVKPL